MIDLKISLIRNELMFIESIKDDYEDQFISESFVIKLKDALDKFFTKIVSSMKYFYKSVKNDIEASVKEKHLKDKLKEERDAILNDPDHKTKKYKCFDITKFERVYQQYISKLDLLYKNIVSQKYKTRDQLIDAMDEFDSILEKFDNELDDIIKNTNITLTCEEYIYQIDSILSGRSHILKDYVRHIHDINELGLKAEKSFSDIHISDDDEVLKQVWLVNVKKATNSFSKKLNKKISKFVATTVFLLA